MPIDWSAPAARAAVLDVLRQARFFVFAYRQTSSVRFRQECADRLLAEIDALLREEGDA
jgi:hypothetical protein